MVLIQWEKEFFMNWQIEKGIFTLIQRMWEIMIRTFSFGMKQQWYILLAVGIKMLITQRVDERLSDTGVRE